MLLLGNKSDLNEFRQVSKDTAQKYADNWYMKYYEISAKNSILSYLEKIFGLFTKQTRQHSYRIHDPFPDKNEQKISLLGTKKEKTCCHCLIN